MKHIFAFPFGVIVFWACRPEDEQAFVKMIKDVVEQPLSRQEMEEGSDDMTFSVGTEGKIFQDEVTLTTQNAEERLALSWAMAQV